MIEQTQATLEVAKSISDYGVLIVIGAVYIVLSAAMMVAVFRWFKSLIGGIIKQRDTENRQLSEQRNKETSELLDRISDLAAMLSEMTEGLRTETQLRIRNLSGFAFDLSVEQVCRLIKKVRTENHIANRTATAAKIRKLLQNIHEDRKSRFDSFVYHGKPISTYCNPEWVEQVATVVEGEIYNDNGVDNGRAYTNVKMIYDNIKIDFYHRINE